MEIAILKWIWNFIKLWLKNKEIWNLYFKSRKIDRLRLSFSYLFRIEIDGEYMLIKGNRIAHQYQLVGGVYKYYEGAIDFLQSISFENDVDSYKVDLDRDLRIYIKGNKLIAFINWFEKGSNREIHFNREFKEELFDSNILDKDVFRDLTYTKLKSHYSEIHYSKHFSCYELLYADIIKPNFNQDQYKKLRELKENGHDKIRWVNRDMILRDGYNCATGKSEYKIAENAKWIFNN